MIEKCCSLVSILDSKQLNFISLSEIRLNQFRFKRIFLGHNISKASVFLRIWVQIQPNFLYLKIQKTSNDK